MYEPKAKWIEEGDASFLMWGHIKVGEVTLGGNGTWYAYYSSDRNGTVKSLKDFSAFDLAQRQVERALARAAEPHP